MESLTIYKSSAGSGKTTVLTREFLKMAIMGNFRNVLAVTFTNKATNELKERVVKALANFSKEEQPGEASGQIMNDLGMDHSTFRARCEEVLNAILNNYGVFSISTIDAFFQKIIRSFARESGVQGNFRLELDHEEVLDAAIDKLLEKAGHNETLTRWLIRFSNETVEQGENSDLARQIRDLGSEVFGEEFKLEQEKVLKEGSVERFEELEGLMTGLLRQFSKELSSAGKAILSDLKAGGFSLDDIKGGLNGQILQISYGNYPNYGIKTFVKALADIEEWVIKSHPRRQELIDIIGKGPFPELQRVDQYIQQNSTDHYTARVILKNLYTYGIISDLLKEIESYKHENDIMLLSDSTAFLRKIIDGYDSPFIYEKVGNRYSHYLIDEFQDTSRFQWINFFPLVENAVAQGQPSIIVGDIKQSIYRWRGGDWDLLGSQVERDIPSARIKQLQMNWRSEGRIIRFNNEFFSKAVSITAGVFADSVAKQIEGLDTTDFEEYMKGLYNDVEQIIPDHTDPETGYIRMEKIHAKPGKEFNAEAIDRIPGIIEELQQNGMRARDIAILVRRRAEGEEVAAHLINYARSEKAKAGVNYEVVSSEILRVANSAAVHLMLAVMHWMNRRQDKISLVSFLTDHVVYYGTEARSLTEVLEHIKTGDIAGILPGNFEAEADRISRKQLFELTEEIIRLFELDKREQDWPYILGFQDQVLNYVQTEAGDLDSFLRWWDQNGWDVPVNISEDIDAIRILTIHKAKGLQFNAVLLPFCSWTIEPGSFRGQIIWSGTDQAPFDMFSVYPLKYSKDLAFSHFRNAYFNEKYRHFIDNLNMVYVAFTRAIMAMYILFPEDKGTDRISGILTRSCSDMMQDDVYSSGSLANSAIEEQKVEEEVISLKDFHSHAWDDRVTVAARELIKLDEEVYARVETGILMHDILSEVRDPNDLERIMKSYVLQGRLPSSEYHEIEKVLRGILSNEQVSQWFTEGEVINEGVILGRGGSWKRPDKVIVRKDRVIVVDFKTGSQRDSHLKQVRDYMELLADMYEKRVEGFVLYLQPFDLIKVD